MRSSSKSLWAAVALCLAMALPAAEVAQATPRYEAYGSCASKKPFKRAHRCGYDAPEEARGTFVLKSNVGKRTSKVCQKITGVPFDRKHQCLKAGSFSYEAVPFAFTGARAPIKVKVTWFVEEPGRGAGFVKAATARLKFVP